MPWNSYRDWHKRGNFWDFFKIQWSLIYRANIHRDCSGISKILVFAVRTVWSELLNSDWFNVLVWKYGSIQNRFRDKVSELVGELMVDRLWFIIYESSIKLEMTRAEAFESLKAMKVELLTLLRTRFYSVTFWCRTIF